MKTVKVFKHGFKPQSPLTHSKTIEFIALSTKGSATLHILHPIPTSPNFNFDNCRFTINIPVSFQPETPEIQNECQNAGLCQHQILHEIFLKESVIHRKSMMRASCQSGKHQTQDHFP